MSKNTTNNKGFLCPSCKNNLYEVGFITKEVAQQTFLWNWLYNWKTKENSFEPTLAETEGLDEEVLAFCKACDSELDWIELSQKLPL